MSKVMLVSKCRRMQVYRTSLYLSGQIRADRHRENFKAPSRGTPQDKQQAGRYDTIAAHLFEAVESARASVQLQVGHVVEEIQLWISVRQFHQILEAGREGARQLPQQIHMLLGMSPFCEHIQGQQALSAVLPHAKSVQPVWRLSTHA